MKKAAASETHGEKEVSTLFYLSLSLCPDRSSTLSLLWHVMFEREIAARTHTRIGEGKNSFLDERNNFVQVPKSGGKKDSLSLNPSFSLFLSLSFQHALSLSISTSEVKREKKRLKGFNFVDGRKRIFIIRN